MVNPSCCSSSTLPSSQESLNEELNTAALPDDSQKEQAQIDADPKVLDQYSLVPDDSSTKAMRVRLLSPIERELTLSTSRIGDWSGYIVWNGIEECYMHHYKFEFSGEAGHFASIKKIP